MGVVKWILRGNSGRCRRPPTPTFIVDSLGQTPSRLDRQIDFVI
ncbi:hypothetical protein ALC56_12235 [Trachymyrmex septentrionalis]|uniref:Uncharacterized protein n=1 Tax=Trachymyrmex septentrionalis TaxID=34720 RepID=A0A195EZ78_9HYME|nr:hypothetical protein ALC56_12235 [Trachymyrmex septentrionalis]